MALLIFIKHGIVLVRGMVFTQAMYNTVGCGQGMVILGFVAGLYNRVTWCFMKSLLTFFMRDTRAVAR